MGEVPDTGDGDVHRALVELAQAREATYYDDGADSEAERATTPDWTATPEELFRTLSGLVTRTHHSQPSYKPGVHLYPAVDLQPNGQLRSIYTGDEFAPEDFIVDDARVEQCRKEALEARLTASTLLTRSHRGAVEAEVEAELPFNCEHVVPQSWFAKKEPMGGDLHHLFACEKTCNSFRGNTPYFDFSDFRDVVRERCGKTGVDGFEPHEGKGAAARSHLLLPPPLPRRDQPRPGAGTRAASSCSQRGIRPSGSRTTSGTATGRSRSSRETATLSWTSQSSLGGSTSL